MVVLVQCLPVLCAPTGPGTPFATPMLAALDTVRLLLSVVALGIVWLTMRAAAGADIPRRQRARYTALALFAAATIGTELAHLGDTAHYRLGLNAAGVVAALVGLLGDDDRRGRHAA